MCEINEHEIMLMPNPSVGFSTTSILIQLPAPDPHTPTTTTLNPSPILSHTHIDTLSFLWFIKGSYPRRWSPSSPGKNLNRYLFFLLSFPRRTSIHKELMPALGSGDGVQQNSAVLVLTSQHCQACFFVEIQIQYCSSLPANANAQAYHMLLETSLCQSPILLDYELLWKPMPTAWALRFAI